MALTEMTLEKLKELDFGRVSLAFQQHLARVVDDCMDRPGDGTAREVELRFLIKPGESQTARGISLTARSLWGGESTLK